MDEYYDSDFDEEKMKFEGDVKKTKTNPAGPYKVKMVFKGVKWDIKIENVTLEMFKISAKSNVKVDKQEVEILKKYIKDEGFELAAKKHNLFW